MPTTGRDIVDQALRKAGILGSGQAASASDQSDALADLNDMLAQARTDRFMVYNELDVGFTSNGNFTYSVGPGGDYNVSPRPNRVQSAYVRQLQNSGLQVDQPLRVIEAREEYSRIATKQLVSFPQAVYLETAYPMGILHVYPIPNAAIYQVHLVLKDTLPMVTPDTVMDVFPAEYLPWMKFRLAQKLRQAYGKGFRPDPELNRQAALAERTIINSNLQVANLIMPVAVLPRGSGYNILSDQFGNG